jgi:glycosyltransferase involved in cell wall biosynthesis
MTHLEKRYRIGIDCRLLGKQHAGIGRYVENLVLQIPEQKHAEQIDWVFFFFDKKQWNQFLEESKYTSFFEKAEVVFAPIRHYSIDEQLHMPAIFSEARLDLLHIPHFNIALSYPGKTVVTIHDLLWHEYQGTSVTTLPAWKYWMKHFAYRFIVSKAVAKAALIFVPAQSVKETVSNYFPKAKSKIVVTPEGIGSTFLSHTFQHQELPKEKKLVYVGSLYPHKNIEVVLQSLKQLPEYQLVLVGSRNVFQDQIRDRVKKLQLENQVTFKGYLPDKELIELFHHCFALVQPSLFEGFGLTGVEAMSVGLPVIASDIPVFKEVYKDRAILFDPQSSEDFIKKVKTLENKETYNKHTQFAHSVKKEFSWQHMTTQVISSYQSVLSG